MSGANYKQPAMDGAKAASEAIITETKGTFSAFGLNQLGADSAEERQVTEQKKANLLLERIAKNTEEGPEFE